MKILNIILLILIIIGVGLLFTQKLWVPTLVSQILIFEGVSSTSTTPSIEDDGMDKWNWVISETSPQGMKFTYPNPLPTKFVTTQVWPPSVVLAQGEFSCVEGEAVAQGESFKNIKSYLINGKQYCVAISNEGAAGSTYTSYDYSTVHGDFLVHVSFVLRSPQCMNYDEPEQGACKTEQANFDTDALVDRIVSSIEVL